MRGNTFLTPKRRNLNKTARVRADAMADTWYKRTGAWSGNAMMGLGIRTGFIHRYIVAHVEAHDAFPTGIHFIKNDTDKGIDDVLRIEFAEDGMSKGGLYSGWTEATAQLHQRIAESRAKREAENSNEENEHEKQDQ